MAESTGKGDRAAAEARAKAFAAAGETKKAERKPAKPSPLDDEDADVELENIPSKKAPPGLKIPGYEILELLGKGGMGSVYKARQKSLDRIVALKVLSPDIARDETYLKRFTTEARALARLNHENIIAGIDVGEANGYRYFAMEYVEGESLAGVIEKEGVLQERRAVTIAMQIARALQHADKSSLVHRDVKPQNIMVGKNDVAKLCDLGLAMTAEERKEASGRGQSIGTPHYISPEQARGEHRVDIRSDIYSLGATLFHAVTGETPFTGTSPMVLMTKHLTEDLTPPRKKNPKVSKALDAVIVKMMAKDKDERYQTPTELLEDLERVLAGRGVEGGAKGGKAAPRGAGARPAKAAKPARAAAKGRSRREDDEDMDEEGEEEEREERFKRPKKQDPRVLGLISLFVLLIGGLLALALWNAGANRPPAPPPPPSAEMESAARQSFENVKRAYEQKDIDKYVTMNKLDEIARTFERTQGAKMAKEFYEIVKAAPLEKKDDAPPPDDDEDLGPPRKKTPPAGE